MKNKTGSFDILISDFDERFFKVDFPCLFNEAMLDAVRSVQELLGHEDVKNTQIYTHVLNKGPNGMVSPLDVI